MDDSTLVVVHRFNNRQEAEMAVSALDAAEIDAMIKDDDAGGMRPSLSFVHGVEVLVRSDDEGAARDVLDLPAKPVAE